MRDVVMIDHETKLEPVLSFFKKGHSHMAVVTKVEQADEARDPTLKMIGIITLEDIIEELVDKGDDDEEDLEELEERQIRHKEKLILLFSDQQKRQEGEQLSDVETHAVCEFLQKQIKAFGQNRIRKKVLYRLITQNSQVVEISSEMPVAEVSQKYRVPEQGRANIQPLGGDGGSAFKMRLGSQGRQPLQ